MQLKKGGQDIHFEEDPWTPICLVVVVENEACTGKVEVEGCFTREGKMVDKSSFCWQVNSMGKLEVAEKKWRRLLSGAEIEVICSAVAQRD